MCRGCVVLGAHGHPEREIMLFAVMYAMRDNNARDAKVFGFEGTYMYHGQVLKLQWSTVRCFCVCMHVIMLARM